MSQKTFSLNEYFEFEYKEQMQHEYHNGSIVARAFSSDNHNQIVNNLIVNIGNCLLNVEAELFFCKRMLYVENCNAIFYPDVMIFANAKEYFYYVPKKMDAHTNPSVWIEVLSDSTEHIDTVGIKKQSFRYIASLKQYILISQDEKYIEVYKKEETSGNWIVELFTTDDEKITIGQCPILLKEIYRKVDFPIVEAVSES